MQGIVKCCESRFNRGPASDWKHSDFSDLSREILQDTDVNISPNTLKRIFGKISVDDDYLPQQATVDALTKYGRYTPSEEPIENAAHFEENEPVVEKQKGKPYKWIVISAIILVAVCVLLLLRFLKPEPALSGNITQTSIEGLLPATAFFDLQLPQSNDSLFVDFGDKSPLLYIKPGQKTTAHNYVFPGVFKVSLKTAQTVLSSVNVSIRSTGWIGLAYPPQGTPPARYYHTPAGKAGTDSLFHIGNGALHDVGIDTVGMYYTRLCNFAPINYGGEDFVFEAAFKNALPGKGISCIGTQFQVSGTEGPIRFKLVNAGCSYRVINVMSEQTFDGRIENLSQFVVDLEKWNTIRLVNQNKQVTLYINGKQLFAGTYKESLGKIQGLFLEFEGNGFIKNCDLKTLDGKLLYRF